MHNYPLCVDIIKKNKINRRVENYFKKGGGKFSGYLHSGKIESGYGKKGRTWTVGL